MPAADSEFACARCQGTLDAHNHYFSEDGPICDRCEIRGELSARFLAQYKSSGYGALGAGLLSLVLNPYFACTLMGASSFLWTLRSAAVKDPMEVQIVAANPGPKIAAWLALPFIALGLVAGVAGWADLLWSWLR